MHERRASAMGVAHIANVFSKSFVCMSRLILVCALLALTSNGQALASYVLIKVRPDVHEALDQSLCLPLKTDNIPG